MLQRTKATGGSQLGGGLVTLPNFFNLDQSQTPNAIDVKFDIGGSIQKRFGATTINAAANVLPTSAGWGMFDFGAGGDLRWLIVGAGTGVFASSNRGVTFVAIATGPAGAQDHKNFERSRPYLIITADSQSAPLYWTGSEGTYAAQIAVGSAPSARYAIDFQGFLMLMNTTARKRGIYYADNNLLLTDPWTNVFDLPSSFDDEITGATILNKKLYVFTKFKAFRVSYVGGNPDFSYQDVKEWGAVPRTIKKITMPEVGEVIIALGWDKKLRIFDGSEDEIISDTVERSNNMSPVNLEQINLNAVDHVFAEVDTNEQVYKLWVALAPSLQATHLMAYNYRIEKGAFYAYRNQRYMAAVMAESGGTNDRALLTMSSAGYVIKVDTLNTDFGTAVDEYFDSPFFFGRTPQVATKDQRISFYFSTGSFGAIDFYDRANFSDSFGQPKHRIVFSDTGGKIQLVKTLDIARTQNVYQFRISSSASTAMPWRLNRYDLEQSDLGVGKA